MTGFYPSILENGVPLWWSKEVCNIVYGRSPVPNLWSFHTLAMDKLTSCAKHLIKTALGWFARTSDCTPRIFPAMLDALHWIIFPHHKDRLLTFHRTCHHCPDRATHVDHFSISWTRLTGISAPEKMFVVRSTRIYQAVVRPVESAEVL